MYVARLDINNRLYFASATILIAIPTGLKVVNWLYSMVGSINVFTNSRLYVGRLIG
jgi:cytochrome c oxidase subunit 1